MVDSRQKGSRAETQAKEVLVKHTKLNWQRTPGSGALNETHKLKGDLYIPETNNRFCIEVKHYKEDHLTSKLLTDKSPQLLEWWSQALRQGSQVDKLPLLLFKFDRSKWFVAFTVFPDRMVKYMELTFDRNKPSMYIAKLEDWLVEEAPEFIQ